MGLTGRGAANDLILSPAGNAAQALLHSHALPPLKLLYAMQLAEYGHVSQAAQYCQVVLGHLEALGTKMPPGLRICVSMTRDLLDRLQSHAQVGRGLPGVV